MLLYSLESLTGNQCVTLTAGSRCDPCDYVNECVGLLTPLASRLPVRKLVSFNEMLQFLILPVGFSPPPFLPTVCLLSLFNLSETFVLRVDLVGGVGDFWFCVSLGHP